MSKRWFPFISLVSLSGSLLLTPTGAIAAPMPLTQATLRKVVKDVKIFLNQQPSRPAQINDRLGSGDALKTAQASRAELKFNDGTLAKVGEYATFRFTPNSRRFDLQNGTYLFLVPPGRGNTEIYTPNARAGVHGSALFIRYDAETDTTTMGALTNNPLGPMDITVGNQKQDLYAGQMAVVIKNKIDRVETFDLRTFYNTSSLFKDVDLSDPEVRAVRLEISDALQLQGVLQNGSALSQTPANLSPSAAAPSVIAPIVSPMRPLIDPSIAQLREPLVVKSPSIPSVIKPIPTPLPTGNPVNSIENPIPIVPRPIKQAPVVTTPKSTKDPIETTTPIESTPIIKAEPTPIKAEPLPIKVEPKSISVEPAPIRVEPPVPIRVEPKPIRVEPKPIRTEPIAVTEEPKAIEPSVNPRDQHHNPIKIVIPKTDVTFSTPKTDVHIETPKVEIIIQPTKTNTGNLGIPILEIPKFDAPKILETPVTDRPRVNVRPDITVDVPVNVAPRSIPATPAPPPELIRTAQPDTLISSPQTIFVPVVVPVVPVVVPTVVTPTLATPTLATPALVTPVALPIVQPLTQPVILQDTPIAKPTIVEPIPMPVVVPTTPMMSTKVAPVTAIDVPKVTTVITPPPTVVTPPSTVITPPPTVVTPPPTVVTPPPTVVTPTPTVITQPPTVVTPTVTPTPVIVPVKPTP